MSSITETQAFRRSDVGPADAIQRFEIWPHRSLGARGICHVLAAVAAGGVYIVTWSPAAVFWPLAVGVAVTLIAVTLAFWCNHQAARQSEIVEIGPDVVRISRTDRRGPRDGCVEFNTSWVRLIVSDDRYVANRLTFMQSGRSCSIGAHLSPAERCALAREIGDCLVRLRGAATN